MTIVINKLYEGRQYKLLNVRSKSRKDVWHTVTVMRDKYMCSCELDMRGRGMFTTIGFKIVRLKDCPHIIDVKKRLKDGY